MRRAHSEFIGEAPSSGWRLGVSSSSPNWVNWLDPEAEAVEDVAEAEAEEEAEA